MQTITTQYAAPSESYPQKISTLVTDSHPFSWQYATQYRMSQCYSWAFALEISFPTITQLRPNHGRCTSKRKQFWCEGGVKVEMNQLIKKLSQTCGASVGWIPHWLSSYRVYPLLYINSDMSPSNTYRWSTPLKIINCMSSTTNYIKFVNNHRILLKKKQPSKRE